MGHPNVSRHTVIYSEEVSTEIFPSLSLLHNFRTIGYTGAANKLFFFRFGHKRRGGYKAGKQRPLERRMYGVFHKTEMKIWAGQKFGQHIMYCQMTAFCV